MQEKEKNNYVIPYTIYVIRYAIRNMHGKHNIHESFANAQGEKAEASD